LHQGMVYYQMQNKDQTIKAWETYLMRAPRNRQHQSVRKAIDHLKDKNFKWPEKEKPVYVIPANAKVEIAQGERDRGNKIVEGKDGAKSGDGKVNEKDVKDGEGKLVNDLKESENEEANKEVDESVENLKVDSDDLKVKDQDKKEGKEYNEIER